MRNERGREFVLNVAFTGAVSKKARNPAVPYRIDEIVENAVECARLGATMGHFHVRGPNGEATNDPVLYTELFSALRATHETSDLVLVASTSGRDGQTLAERSAVLELPQDARPDMASLTLSSLNFGTGPSINHPNDIIALARKMRANGIRPELEVFDLGMVNFLHKLIDDGILEAPYYINLILGNMAGAQADALSIGALMAALPQGAIVSLGGIGRWQLPAHLFAVAQADGLRTGLEDNLRCFDGKTLASNCAHARHAADLIRMGGRVVMRPKDLRARLNLPHN